MHGDTYKSFVSENVYTQQVLDKDYDYYCHNFAFASAALTWTFPMNLGKAGYANGYVRLTGNATRALPAGNLNAASLAIGLFTF